MRYRRADVPGATYFITFNAADRSSRLLTDHIVVLRASFGAVRVWHPFVIEAICVLPEHLHVLMTLPPGDADFAKRIMLIKRNFSLHVSGRESRCASRVSKGERGLWQRRHWEHLIRDARDFERHVDYIHFNPVKHGWAARAADWPFSSIHRFIRAGRADQNWGVATPITGGFGER